MTYEEFLLQRGVELQDACTRCHGAGQGLYASTATWHGGAGGMTPTVDVCDKCWGTGSKTRSGVNLRAVYSEFQALQRQVEELKTVNARMREVVETYDDRFATLYDEKQSEVRVLQAQVSALRRLRGGFDAEGAYTEGTDCY